MADISWCTKTDNFSVWGIPFFNVNNNTEFESAINDIVLQYNPSDSQVPQLAYVIIQTPEVPKDLKFTKFLPVYSVRAACGSFEESKSIPEEEAEGWVDISETKVKANKNMFLVHAIGDSMAPKINDGDLCLFELYGAESAGSRDGKIVLTKCVDKDSDYECSFTIKEYHSEKEETEDGIRHRAIQLRSLNPEFAAIDILPEEADHYQTVGILRHVIRSQE